MLIGITLGHGGESVRDIAAYATHAENAGLDLVGFSDSQSVFRDTYCAMTACALATSRLGLVTTMTNVSTRHPVVTANSIATVDEVSGGRAWLGIGTGASSTSNLGLPRAKPSELRAGVETINRAFRQALGREEPDGTTTLLAWPTRAVPVIVGASTSGPMAMRVAAECADGVMLIGDVDQVTLSDRIARLRELRAAGPRAGDPFTITVYAPSWVDEGPGTGHETIGGVVSSIGAAILDESKPEHRIPEELAPAFAEFRARYSFKDHASKVGYDLASELGVADHLFSRVAIGGTPSELLDRFASLEQIGVDHVYVTGYVPDKGGLIDRLGSVVQDFHGERVAA